MMIPTGKRLAVIGKTGSGKTQAGIWALSFADVKSQPWIIVDYKRDRLIADIKPKPIKLGQRLPTEPGLYVIRPNIGEDDAVEKFMWDVWRTENIGLFFDEGYMIGDSQAFRALLTQGRSKNITMIILCQRPVFMTRFVWSEADYFMVFRLVAADDIKSIRGFFDVPKETLPLYHGYFYDVAEDRVRVLRPAPDRDIIVEKFRKAKSRKFV